LTVIGLHVLYKLFLYYLFSFSFDIWNTSMKINLSSFSSFFLSINGVLLSVFTFIIIFSSLICRKHDACNQTGPILTLNPVLYYWISNWCDANRVEQRKRLKWYYGKRFPHLRLFILWKILWWSSEIVLLIKTILIIEGPALINHARMKPNVIFLLDLCIRPSSIYHLIFTSYTIFVWWVFFEGICLLSCSLLHKYVNLFWIGIWCLDKFSKHGWICSYLLPTKLSYCYILTNKIIKFNICLVCDSY